MPTSDSNIPYGYCHCGCGQKTKIATQSSTRNGYTKGVPRHYVVGHANRNREDVTLRFWSKVDKSKGENECWIWLASRDNQGYGRFNVKGKGLKAHRFSYFLAHGDLPKNLDICHACDNPSCVNPQHLFAGTTTDNMHDMIRKGRAKAHKGESHPSAKLTAAQVEDIRAQYAKGGIKLKELAEIYHVTFGNIGHIVRRKTWS